MEICLERLVTESLDKGLPEHRVGYFVCLYVLRRNPRRLLVSPLSQMAGWTLISVALGKDQESLGNLEYDFDIQKRITRQVIGTSK